MSSTMAETWSIASMKKCQMTPSSAQLLLGPSNICLENMVAYDIEIETFMGNRKRGRKTTLHGVPLFLVEAFTWLEDNNAFNVEGIFRKPGNAGRIRNPWQIFCGLSGIPDNYTVHDVCTLIMRFFGSLKKPILAEQQNQIISTVAAIANEKVQAEAVLSFIDLLPTANQATLAFLMRQLKKINDHSDANQMTAANLAICFAPAIFVDPNTKTRSCSTSIWSNSSDGASRLVGRSLQSIGNCRKKKTDSQESLREIDFAKRRKGLQASVVQLLIQYANHICDGPRRLPGIGRGFLQRKHSELPQIRSPIAVTSEQAQVLDKSSSGTATSNERYGRSRAPSRSDKVWPRSASEKPFNRTRALFLHHLPFGKNGSFAPREDGHDKLYGQNTPKVQQSRPPIACQSPVGNHEERGGMAAIHFISPSSTAATDHSHQSQPANLDSTPKHHPYYHNDGGAAIKTAAAEANTSVNLFQRFFS